MAAVRAAALPKTGWADKQATEVRYEWIAVATAVMLAVGTAGVGGRCKRWGPLVGMQRKRWEPLDGMQAVGGDGGHAMQAVGTARGKRWGPLTLTLF